MKKSRNHLELARRLTLRRGVPNAPSAKEVPTEEDFEEKAAAEVNTGNLEDEVKKLEKEIVPPE